MMRRAGKHCLLRPGRARSPVFASKVSRRVCRWQHGTDRSSARFRRRFRRARSTHGGPKRHNSWLTQPFLLEQRHVPVCTICNKRAVSGDDLDLADPLNVKDRGTEASYIQSGAGRFDTRIDGLGNGEIQLSRLSIWLEMGIGKHVKIYCRILRVPFPLFLRRRRRAEQPMQDDSRRASPVQADPAPGSRRNRPTDCQCVPLSAAHIPDCSRRHGPPPCSSTCR